MTARTAPCEWPLAALDCSALTGLDYGLDDIIEQMATAFLWNWTGRVFGLCDLTVRPCRQDCTDTASTYYRAGGPFTPVLVDGEWSNLSCGACGDVCGCDNPSMLGLPGPVAAIVDVTIDGQQVPPAAYRVDNRRLLVRVDGGTWPTCQDLGKPAGQPGTWTIQYRRGVPVPMGGQVAAAVLACEMAKAVTGGECRLPQRLQTVTREGVTVGILDTFEGLTQGATGLWIVDSWVASIVKRPKGAQVLSPDYRPPRVRTDQP